VFLLAVCAASLGGCAVVAAADTAAGLAVSGVGLAADAAIGTVRITGKVIGATADLVIPDGPSD
jgi:type 1 fimbria pilin